MPDSRDEQLAKLEQQLSEVLAAEEFSDSASGRLWMQIATRRIQNAIDDITSNKYEKDHMGYIKRLADLQAYKLMIRSMQVAAAPKRKQKIQESIGTEDGSE